MTEGLTPSFIEALGNTTFQHYYAKYVEEFDLNPNRAQRLASLKMEMVMNMVNLTLQEDIKGLKNGSE